MSEEIEVTESEELIESVRSEIQDYVQEQKHRRYLFPRAALVGFFAGALGVFFRGLLVYGSNFRTNLVVWCHQHGPATYALPILFGCAGATFAVWLTNTFAPEAAGSGIPHIEAVLHRLRPFRWVRVLIVKFIGGMTAISGGMALGREGPTVQMGGAVGAGVAQWLKLGVQDRMTLIAAGSGAGLAAAFNAPLAGLIFVLEEVQKDFRQAIFGSAFIAAAVADIVTRSVAGQVPVFSAPKYPVPPLTSLPIFAILGVLAGLLGVVYNSSLIRALDIVKKVPKKYILLLAAGVGALVGLAALIDPISAGDGHALAETVLLAKPLLATIPLWFAVRLLMSIGSYAVGPPGGIFAPLLALGSLIGLFVGDISNHFMPALAPNPGVFAVVGMAAYFAAIVRAPLTGIVLIIEMTGTYAQMLALIVSCFMAYLVAEGFKSMPIYEHLLERDLTQGKPVESLEHNRVFEFEVQAESKFSGKLIKDLGLPPGCIIVSCRNGAREWVPTATTRLEPHTKITAIVGSDSDGALDALRDGCHAHRE